VFPSSFFGNSEERGNGHMPTPRKRNDGIVPSDLFNDTVAFIKKYLVLTDEQADTLALWVAHTHAFEAADCTPYMHISSAEKSSGKTLLLEVLELLVAKPWLTGRTTGPALQRKVSAQQPTLLLDETDALFHGGQSAEAQRGMINTGYRRGGKTTVAEGSNGAEGTHDYETFCPKAFAGIGNLPDTIMSRSVPVRMERKTKGEVVSRFRRREARPAGEELATEMKVWVASIYTRLVDARPKLPDELPDRAQDVWEPLLAIADAIGGRWPKRARDAAMTLSGKQAAAHPSTGQMLLADLYTIFEGHTKLTTEDIIVKLFGLEESPWEGFRGRGFNQRDLGSILQRYGLKSHTIRLGKRTAMGYDRGDFVQAWARYCEIDPKEAMAASHAK
jgi:hypothetical protein